MQLTLIIQLAYPDNPGHPWASCAGREQGCHNCGVISFCRNLFSRGKSALSRPQTSKVFGGYMREVVDWAPPHTKHSAIKLNWGQYLSNLQTNFQSDFVVNATAAERPTVNNYYSYFPTTGKTPDITIPPTNSPSTGKTPDIIISSSPSVGKGTNPNKSRG